MLAYVFQSKDMRKMETLVRVCVWISTGSQHLNGLHFAPASRGKGMLNDLSHYFINLNRIIQMKMEELSDLFHKTGVFRIL